MTTPSPISRAAFLDLCRGATPDELDALHVAEKRADRQERAEWAESIAADRGIQLSQGPALDWTPRAENPARAARMAALLAKK